MKDTSLPSLIFFFAIQVLSVCVAYGQVSKDDTIILLKAFSEVTTQRQIVYIDTVNSDSFIPKHTKEVIEKWKISDNVEENLFNLSKTERDYLLLQLGQQVVWPDNLFSNSKHIDNKSMMPYLNKKNVERSLAIKQATLQNDSVGIRNIQNNIPYVFIFTRPIFFRDNTVCLISFSAWCGDECAYTEACFYKKENNIWTKWERFLKGGY